MTSRIKESRPNCEEILSRKNSWYFSLKQLMKVKNISIGREIMTIRDNFHLFFIKTKLKYDSEFNSSNNCSIL